MAPKRSLKELRTVNHNEDALEGARGPSKAKKADLELEDDDREASGMSGGEDDASSRSDSDFESTRLAARKHTRRKPHSESESEQNTDSERPIKKKRKQKAVRELPGRSARPVTYKDGSSEDDGSEMADDEDVSIGGTTEEAVADDAAPEHDEDQPLSQEDIAEIASADIPAEDVAMLEDGSGADDKAAVSKKPATAPKRRLRLKRTSPDIAPETAGAQDKTADNAGDASEGQTGAGVAGEKKAKEMLLKKLSERAREKKNASENARTRNSRAAAKASPPKPKRRSARDRNAVNLAEPDSGEEGASEEEDGSDFAGSDASSDSDAEMQDEEASASDNNDDFVDDAPRRPPPKKQANGVAVRRSNRAAPSAPKDAHKPKAKKAPAKKGNGKAASTKRKAPASRSRSGSRRTTPADSNEASEEEDASEQSESEIDESDLDRVEKILDVREDKDGKEKFFVKFKEVSYRKAEWVAGEELWEVKAQLLRNFMQRRAVDGAPSDEDEDGGSRGLVNGINPDWLVVDRVVSQRGKGASTEYLVKWCQLSYSEVTWEAAKHLSLAEDKEKIALFKKREQPAAMRKGAATARADVVPTFLNGRKLRDYQRESLKWMMANFRHQKNCILGDEMGLGKTAQSIATLAFQRQFLGIAGPHIVIAPLTTLGHWQREIETWTGMNVVQYTGSKADREVIRKHEFYHANGDSRSKKKRYKFDVLLTSYETVLKDSSVFLGIQDWGTMIADEAHRFKSVSGSTRRVVTSMRVQWKLLLTGTPVQNSMEELFGILNVLDPENYDDEDEFLERFGRGMPTLEQVQDLQAELRPVLLRRMKEDVENLPDKEEVVVWVELTTEQRHFYKAIYGKQIGALLGGASTKNTPQLQNLAMELRKVCCHPFLCRGLEDHMMLRQAARGAAAAEIDRIVNASGKMVLLNKLLPKLRSEGHKVLIFSQFKIMLDVLEDFLRLGGFPFERIDGSVSQRDREDAINRYSKEGSDGFVFLLSTRAGGQGITLTAADTVIIYDTDFNPQNDLQAMARCHRIGQDKEVKVYRLITSGTYEQNVFECSTRKQGLDNAILGFLNADERKVDGARIAQLLAHGAHALNAPDEDTLKEGEAFASEDIDAILARRTEKRQLGNSKGNTFSTATFAIQEEDAMAGPGDPREYWSAILPEAVAEHDAQMAAAARPVDLGKRQRRKVVYNEVELGRAKASDGSSSSSSGSEFEADDAADDEDEDGSGDGSGSGLVEEGADGKRKRKRTKEEKKEREWRQTELKALEEVLLLYGDGETQKLRARAGLEKRSVEEVALVEQALVRVIKRAAELPQPPKVDKAATAEGASAAAPPPPALPQLVSELQIPRFARKAFEGALGRLEKHGRRHAAQLRDRAALNHLAAEANPFKEALSLASLVPKASNLPAAWTVTEDTRLLLSAQRWGYYPNSMARRQNASEGFVARFMVQYTPVRLDPQSDEKKLAEAAGNTAAGSSGEPAAASAAANGAAAAAVAVRDNAPAQAPAAGAAGDKPAVTAVAKSDNAPALAPAPAVEDKTAAAEGSPSKPGAVTKKVFRPPWMRAAAEKASSQAPPAQEAPKPAPAEAKPEAKAAPPLKTPEDEEADDMAVTFDTLELVETSKWQSMIQAVGRRYRALVQVVVSPEAARAEAAKTAEAEAQAAARREKRKAEKALERAARKEAERKARKEQKHLERRAHLEKLAAGCFGTSDANRAGQEGTDAGNEERRNKPPSAKKRPPSAGIRSELTGRRLSHGQLLARPKDDDFVSPKKAHSGARGEKENSMGGRAANVPAAVAGEGIMRKPHLPKAHQSVSSAKRKALKQTTLSFAKKPHTAPGPAATADDAIIISEVEPDIVIE